MRVGRAKWLHSVRTPPIVGAPAIDCDFRMPRCTEGGRQVTSRAREAVRKGRAARPACGGGGVELCEDAEGVRGFKKGCTYPHGGLAAPRQSTAASSSSATAKPAFVMVMGRWGKEGKEERRGDSPRGRKIPTSPGMQSSRASQRWGDSASAIVRSTKRAVVRDSGGAMLKGNGTFALCGGGDLPSSRLLLLQWQQGRNTRIVSTAHVRLHMLFHALHIRLQSFLDKA